MSTAAGKFKIYRYGSDIITNSSSDPRFQIYELSQIQLGLISASAIPDEIYTTIRVAMNLDPTFPSCD